MMSRQLKFSDRNPTGRSGMDGPKKPSWKISGLKTRDRHTDFIFPKTSAKNRSE